MSQLVNRRRAARPPPRALRWRRLLRHLREFCLATPLSGYRHLARPGVSAAERVFWAAVLATAVGAAVYIILVEWDFHLARFTITTLAGAHLPVWQMPFPGVTVCDINKVPLSRAMAFLETAILPANMTGEEALQEMAHLVELIEYEQLDPRKLARLQELLRVNGILGDRVARFMRNLTTPCNELLAQCRWKGVRQPCEDVFTMRRTYEGYCCSFNYLGINSDFVRHDVEMVRDAPKRVSSAGTQTGLSVMVVTRTSEYHATVMTSYGVKVLLHDPYDYPSMNVVKKVVAVGSETFFALQPWVTYATSSVRWVASQKRSWRGCLFPDERQLALMRRYSYDNCMMECRRNASYTFCGCTPFFYPNDGTMPICDLSDTPCLAEHTLLLQTMYPGNNATLEELDKEPFKYPCLCVPDCQNNYYPIEDYGGDLATVASNSRVLFEENLDIGNHSVFHVYFGNFMATHYRRTILYSWYSLLGSFGGILGLLLGFSLLSGFEFIYFFTFRFYFKYRDMFKIETEKGIKTVKSNVTHTYKPFTLKSKNHVLISGHAVLHEPLFYNTLI